MENADTKQPLKRLTGVHSRLIYGMIANCQQVLQRNHNNFRTEGKLWWLMLGKVVEHLHIC